MRWSKKYALKSYAKASLWIVPFIAVLMEQVLLYATLAAEDFIPWTPSWSFAPATTVAALQTIISLMLSFIVFTFGSLLVAIQVASGQLTPRIIATTLLRDNVIRYTVGLFIVTLLFAFGAMNRTGETVPRLTVGVALLLGALSLAAFLYLIDYCARLLRPVSMIGRVAEDGSRVIREVYPQPAQSGSENQPELPDTIGETRLAPKTGRSAIALAVDIQGLVATASRHNGTIEFLARIGDFVATGQKLFRLRGGTCKIGDAELNGFVAFGSERTIEQDPTFAFRVIIDIGIKALSKAINDPTTAVLALDQLQHLLRTVGERDLHNDFYYEADNQLRVILPTPNWEEFVQLTFSEIRLYGAENFQIARRMYAMFDSLAESLPPYRKPALDSERLLLDRMIEETYVLPEDRNIARIPDPQGLGGASAGKARV